VRSPPRADPGGPAPDLDDLRGALLRRCSFPPAGTEVVCAVSGGADSLALLVLATAAGCHVTAVHVDHGTRDGAASEAGLVETTALRFGARFEARTVSTPVAAGPNLEARWRDARRAVLPPDALTGHTADDAAETALINLLRGAGLDGLAGIRPGPTKPILGLRRRETRALCDAAGVVVFDDPTNRDPAFLRNRVRAELLPLLDSLAERDVVAVISRQAALLRDDAEFLDAAAAALDPTDARALASAPTPLARRAIRRWLVAGAEHPPDAATVERVLAVARGESRACDLTGGDRVARTGMRLRLTRA